MYNTHRGLMQPQHVPPGNRIPELLEQIRIEFDNSSGRAAGEYEQQREHIIRQQVAEMEQIRDKVHQLENAHAQMKADYEKKISDLSRDLELRGVGPHGGPRRAAQHQPPSIGHGPRDLFGQIMAGGGAQGQASLAAPPQEPQQPQGMPAHLTQVSGLSTGPQLPQHQPYPGYQGPGMNGYGPQPPPLNQSPGPAKPRGRGPPGTSTPQQHHPMPFPASPRGAPGPTPPPGHHAQHRPPPPTYDIPDVGNELGLLKPEAMPNHLKKTGDEWWAVFNPAVPRVLDVHLVHTLEHSSVVCCVRFSLDGKYVATGCNRAAQIFEVQSGAVVAHLEEDTTDKDGDLYIRSVCFSPDGEYLATGAEDKCIRLWNIREKRIIRTLTGHEQDIYSLDFSRNGRLIASGSGDRSVRLWNLEEPSRDPVVLMIEEGVTTVALSPDGRLVAAGSLDKSVRVWDTETGHRIDSLEGPGPASGHGDSVYSVAFSPHADNILISASLDKTIKMWELSLPPPRGSASAPPPRSSAGRCIKTFEGHSDFVLSVCLTPDAQSWLISGSKDRGVVFWDTRSGIPHMHLQGHRNSVISVAPSPVPGGIFATGSGDSRARIWRYEQLHG